MDDFTRGYEAAVKALRDDPVCTDLCNYIAPQQVTSGVLHSVLQRAADYLAAHTPSPPATPSPDEDVSHELTAEAEFGKRIATAAARLAGALAMRERCAEEPKDDVIKAMAFAFWEAWRSQPPSVERAHRGDKDERSLYAMRAANAAMRDAIRSTEPEGK